MDGCMIVPRELEMHIQGAALDVESFSRAEGVIHERAAQLGARATLQRIEHKSTELKNGIREPICSFYYQLESRQ